MAGASSTSAPSSPSRAASPLACARARVTTTRRPNSGRRSNQASRSCSAATSPTSVIAGGRIAAWAAASAMVATVADTVRWSGRVPEAMTAAGVAGAMPSASSRAMFASSDETPIRKTSVPGVRARWAQSRSVPGFAGSSWPVTIVTCAAMPRCVTGMPA